MNTAELKNLLSVVGMLAGSVLAAHNITVSPEQMASIVTNVSVAIPAIVSAASAIYSIWSHWNMKKVPEKSVAISSDHVVNDATQKGDYAMLQTDGDTKLADPNGQATIVAKVVGALLLGFLLCASGNAKAASSVNQCDIITMLKGLSATNFVAKFNSCLNTDFQAAFDNANAAPVDNGALACLGPVLNIQNAIKASPTIGLALAFQLFRRAKQSGVIANCTAYVQSTIALQ